MRARGNGDLLDRAAMALSGLCVVHCLASVLLVAAFATVGGALLDPRIHEGGLLLATAIAALGLGAGFVRHHRRRPAMLGVAGILLMGTALCVRHGIGEAMLTILGVTLVAVAHHMNRRAVPHARLA